MKTIHEQLDAVLGGLETAPEGLAESVTYTPIATNVAVANVPGIVNHEMPDIRGAAETPVEREDGLSRRASITFTFRLAHVASPGVDDLLVRADGTEWVATDVLSRSTVHAVIRFVSITDVERTRKNYRMKG